MILNRSSQYFFCGIGGSGMLPLALIMKGLGYEVEGSDRALDQGRLAQKFTFLQEKGISLHPQDGTGINRTSQVLVTSAAVEPTIPDVQSALRLGIKAVRRAELLAEIFNQAPESVAIGGTSGKSTTTGMAGWILHACGRKPTIMNGAVMKNFVGARNPFASALVGEGSTFISEVDESDGSISLYTPKVAVVTNVSLDHKPLPELRTLFGDFVSRADTAVINLDNEETRSLAARARNALTFSLSDPAASICASSISPAQSHIDFSLHERGSSKSQRCRIQQPGRHNVGNALAALSATRAMGVSLDQACEAISGFTGIKRRFEIVGSRNGITVIDDFAHNPDKIAATLNTLHEFPGRLIVMFQPHGFGPLNLMRTELVDCFARHLNADDMLIMPDPAYYGGTTNRVVGSKDIIDAIRQRGRTAIYCEHRADCLPLVTNAARGGDRIIIMGARDDTLSDFADQVLASLS